MSNYRRYQLAGGTYFFTVNLLQRRDNDLLITHIDLLRQIIQDVKRKHPFVIEGWVVLPEHMHCIWTLPKDDFDYRTRWFLIKSQFSKSLPKVEALSEVRQQRGERGIWQRRYWEHWIRNANDFQKHMDYLHFNPVKHGWVKQVKDWPYSTFHYWVNQGKYAEDWGGMNED